MGRDPDQSFHPFEAQFKGPKKCRPKLIQININLEEAYTGVEV